MERLTSEQIRLLEELRELRDAGILTVEEFEFQVAKVLGRPQVVEPIPFVEEPLAPQEPDETVVAENPDDAQQVEQSDVTDVALVPDTSYESELLEYELVEPDISDKYEILVEENLGVESPTTSDIPALPIADIDPQENNSSRRKALIGTTAGLALIAVIGLVTLVGGGKSASTSTQIIDSATIVTHSTMAAPIEAVTIPATTRAPVTSTQLVADTTTVARKETPTTPTTPTTTTTTLARQCNYQRDSQPVVGNILTTEGIVIEYFPNTYYSFPHPSGGYVPSTSSSRMELPNHFQITSRASEPLRVTILARWVWDGGERRMNSSSIYEPFDTVGSSFIADGAISSSPHTNLRFEWLQVGIDCM